MTTTISSLSLYPVDRNGADDCLSALIDMHMLNRTSCEPPLRNRRRFPLGLCRRAVIDSLRTP